MKRKWIPILVMVMLLVFSTIGLAETIKDVSSSHWAYKSVKTLINKGYLSLYEDNTFRGDKNISRFQLAEVVAKILTRLESGTVTASADDITTIRELTVEFRKELVDIVQSQNLFEGRMTQLEKNQVVMKEDIARSQQQILEMIDRLIDLKDLEEQLKISQDNWVSLKTQIVEMENKLAEGLSFSVQGLNIQMEEVKEQSKDNTNDIQVLKAENQTLKEEIVDLKAKDTQYIFYLIGGLLLSMLVK
ncbi:MAG: S-layer homology domain-containing protein [Halanaerobiales bacterium]|nr:S-layer homology domain-containing protein [Halanaerobiales bacterium]